MRPSSRSLLIVIAFLASVASTPLQGGTPPPPQPTPTPPGGIEQICAGLGWKDCIFQLALRYGVPGIIVFVLVSALVGGVIYFFLSPIGQDLRDENRERFHRWRTKRRLLPIHDRQKLEDEYVKEMDRYLAVSLANDPAKQIAAYLERLRHPGKPFYPDEDAEYIPLEGGLGFEPGPRLALALPPRPDSPQPVFTEVRTFDDIAEAMLEIDQDTGKLYPAFVLLGQPGSGKTTVLRKLARLALQQYQEDSSTPLPLVVDLSEHKAGLPIDFLRRKWCEALGYDGLDQALAEGRLFLFADGLNEIDRERYIRRLPKWRRFLDEHFHPGSNRAVIACREKDYGYGLHLPRLNVHPMDEVRIKHFLNLRFPDKANKVWEAIEADRREHKGYLFELAQVPFWLMIMADSKELSHNRAFLVAEFIDHWLDYEASRDGGRNLNPEERAAFIEGMTFLGWHGLSRSPNYTFLKREACKQLRSGKSERILPAPDLLEVAKSCSLLVVDEASVRFYHQLIQEYFAGRELARRFQTGARLERLWRIPWRDWDFVSSRWDPPPDPPSTRWEEATVLAAGMLEPTQAGKFALALMGVNPTLASRCILEAEAGKIDTVQQQVASKLQAQVKNRRVRLPARLAAGKALGKLGDPRLLRLQGKIKLADERDVTFIKPDWVEDPAGTFRMGTSSQDMASLKKQKTEYYQDEQPDHLVTVSHTFQIGRFPVTVAEYRCFVDAKGYEQEAYWPDETARRWLHGELTFEESYQSYLYKLIKEQADTMIPELDRLVKEERMTPNEARAWRWSAEQEESSFRQRWQELEDEKRDGAGLARHPWLWDDLDYTNPSQPVIGITWYEAQAYVLWLEECLHAAGRLAPDRSIRLPSEAQWEKAARGGEGRLWPWGNRWQAERANTLEGRVMRPSPVGIYPDGASPYGALYMAGDVWEWCQDWYAEDEYARRSGSPVVDPQGPETGTARVVRGGSWYSDRRYARCASRFRFGPDFNNLGFRLAVCTIDLLNS